MKHMSEALLSVDAAIIADNDTHIVISIRVAKERIALNHPLLAEISERIGK